MMIGRVEKIEGENIRIEAFLPTKADADDYARTMVEAGQGRFTTTEVDVWEALQMLNHALASTPASSRKDPS